MRFRRAPLATRLRRLAVVIAMPLLVTVLIVPLTARATSPAQPPTRPAGLDKVTLDAILVAASQPLEAEQTFLSTTTTLPPTTTTTLAPTTTTTRAPHAVGNKGDFALAPGAKLPSDKECAKAVRKAREVRPENKTANNTKVVKPKLGPNWGSHPDAARFMSRVSGSFAGTTDEIIQWASCKWGFEAETVRAQVAVESSWRQGATAATTDDQSKCPPGLTAPCPLAFGLLQIRSDFHPGAYPAVATSTAYNVDYGLAMKRACYEGVSWLGTHTRGDAWGCVGTHYAGKWMTEDARSYIDIVKARYDSKPWRRW